MQPLPQAAQRGILRKRAGGGLVRKASGSEDAALTVQSMEKRQTLDLNSRGGEHSGSTC